MAIDLSNSAAHSELDTRPRAETFTVERLMAAVTRGKIRIPDFQRRLRWESADRLSLFESIYRGYPVGAALFWKRHSPAQRVSFRDLHIDARESSDGLWIVDGQQRIATIASELLASERRAEPKSIFFDSSQRTFVERPATSDDPRLVPLRLALDATALSEWVIEKELDKAARAVVFELGKRLREFEIPSYVVETDNASVLREIFKRINSTGKALHEYEVFDAIVGSTLADGGIASLNQRLAHLQFGPLNEEEVLHRSFEAISGIPLGRGKSPEHAAQDAEQSLRKTERAIGQSIEFLRNDAAIPHVDLLPYSLPLVVLAKFFALFPEPSRSARRRLRRWLWRASLLGELTGASGTLDQFVRMVHTDEHATLTRLMERFQEPTIEHIELSQPFSRSTARGKLELCALVALGPRDPATGDAFDTVALFEHGADRAVHRLARGADSDPAHFTQTLASRLIASRNWSIRKLCDVRSRATLESHAINDAAVAAAQHGELASFLRARHEALTRWVRQWFETMADHHTYDAPPVSALRLIEATLP